MPRKKKSVKRTKKEKSRRNKKKEPIKAVFTGETINSSSIEAKNLYGKSRFGEIVNKKVIYTLVEALYLLEKKKIQISHKGKKLSFSQLIDKLKKLDKKILTNYIVFKDLRNKGYIIKTALKFGAEFRVYDKGAKPGKAHAKWILYPVQETDEFTWHDFAGKNRVAHSTRKNLLIAIVDQEQDISYYEISWTRP